MATHPDHLAQSRQRGRIAGPVIACSLAAVLASSAGASTFSARETRRGLMVAQAGGSTGKLVASAWFRHAGDPTYVYRDGEGVVAGVWDTGPDAAVVRKGTTEDAPVVGRIVPTWKDNALELSIEPTDGPAIRTTVFERPSGGGRLERGKSTREGLEGTYRATVRAGDGKDVGWMSVDIDPEGGTRFAGDLPSTIPPPLAAAAAAAVDAEVASIYGNVVDVNPLRR
jgi:hypothetical protein